MNNTIVIEGLIYHTKMGKCCVYGCEYKADRGYRLAMEVFNSGKLFKFGMNLGICIKCFEDFKLNNDLKLDHSWRNELDLAFIC